MSFRKQDDEYLSFARRVMRGLTKRASQADPYMLGQMLKLRDEYDDMITSVVVELRRAGYSWQWISEVAGQKDRRGAQNQWGKAVEEAERAAGPPPSEG